MTFYEALSIAMREKGITAAELSIRAGVHQSYLSKLKSGHTKDVTWEKALAIIAALDMTPDEFSALQYGKQEDDEGNEMGLKEKRIESGMTQKEAADLFGLKYRTYQNYENGVTSPSMDTAAAFARFFSCTIGDLFNLQEGSSIELSDDEKTLLDVYRSIPVENKKLFLAVASAFAARV